MTTLVVLSGRGVEGRGEDVTYTAEDHDWFPSLEPAGGTTQAPLFAPDAAGRLAQAVRLRRDLGVSYGGAVLACRLLARIDELEARLRRYETPNHRPEVMAWTRTS